MRFVKNGLAGCAVFPPNKPAEQQRGRLRCTARGRRARQPPVATFAQGVLLTPTLVDHDLFLVEASFFRRRFCPNPRRRSQALLAVPVPTVPVSAVPVPTVPVPALGRRRLPAMHVRSRRELRPWACEDSGISVQKIVRDKLWLQPPQTRPTARREGRLLPPWSPPPDTHSPRAEP